MMNFHSSLEAMIKETFPGPHLSSTESLTAASTSSTHDFTPRTPTKSALKSRSLSDSTPILAPSPKLNENQRRTQDDNAIPVTFRTPRRSDPPVGLSLLMPHQEPPSATLFNAACVPVSPTGDTRDTRDTRSPYASPASVLPRHSRGLDFSRAATHLHKSTLAESSPDSSPTITQKAMSIPSRKQSMNAMSIDPPSWQAGYERSVLSSSLGSINMFASDDSSSDGELEPMDPEEREDTILSTPNLHRNTPSASANLYSRAWGSNFFSPAGSNFHSYRRRLNERRSRKSSSSASGHSNLASPGPTSPAPAKVDGAYLNRDNAFRTAASRRESLSVGTNELTISSGNDSGDETGLHTPAVIRRAVTRRGNLLPKTRAFGRIRAELFEETIPVESEVKREAEVIRQVRESDPAPASHAATAHSSPSMQPIASLEGIPEDAAPLLMTLDTNGYSTTSSGSAPSTAKGLFGAFAKNSGTKEFWDTIDKRLTPPPPIFPRGSSSGEDMMMESPIVSQSNHESNFSFNSFSRATTPQTQPISAQPPSAAEGLRKNNKRRRDDDLDTNSLKRRAVSPGLSVTNSPILSQSPAHRGEMWGPSQPSQAKLSRESLVIGNGGGHAAGERSNSVSSVVMGTPSSGAKRVGLQGMNDMQGLTEKMTLE